VPEPQQVRLDVYDDFHHIGTISRSLHDARLPGDAEVLVSTLSTTVRASLVGSSPLTQGSSFFQTTSEAVGRQVIELAREVTMTLTLDTKILPDIDGDGVPDAIDNCPVTFNPDQECARGDGIGDACRGSTADMSVPDLASVATFGCGNGILEAGEQCDSGANNNNSVTTTISNCTTLCRLKANCGNATDANAILDPATGICYATYPTLRNWEDAQRDCQRQGGNLASIGSNTENQRVWSLLNGTTAWIGLSVLPDGSQSWVDGRAVTFFIGTPGGTSSDGGSGGDCYVDSGGSWVPRPCGWPSSGQLDPSPVELHGYVCRFTCGNGVIESPVESCEPPGSVWCTQTCQHVASCSEAQGVTSPTSGHCYFPVTPAVPYVSAICPTGTRLATLQNEAATETALQAVKPVGAAWIGLRSPVTATQWNSGAYFIPHQYHGFVAGQPTATPPDSATVDPVLGGWSDQPAATAYPYLCERL
jgi:hypothetical protein